MSRKNIGVAVSSPASAEELEKRCLLSHSASVAVDNNATFQTIDGLGASIQTNSQPSEYLNSSFYDSLVNDLGATMTRGVIWPTFEKTNDDADPNHFNWSAFDDAAIAPQMEFFKHMKERGASKFVVSVWTPPYWMKTNRSLKNGGVLRPDMRDEYAEYVAAFVIAAKRDFGIDIAGVSLQNEPLFVEPYESTVYNPNQMRELVRAVDAKFKAEGLTTNIMIPEDITFSGRTEWWIGPTMADTTTKNFQGVIAGHSYFKPDSWTDLKNNVVNKYGRKVWMTESSNNAPTWAGGITVGQDLYNALSLGNASAWLYWQYDDNSSNSQFALLTNGVPNPKFYAAKQYYHYIRPGSQRVSASSSDSNLLVTSVKNNPGGGHAIVLVNKGTDDANVSFSVSGTAPSSYRMIRSSATENSADLGTVSGGSSFNVTIPANSIVTLFSGPDLTPGTGTGAQKVPIQAIFDSGNASKLASAATQGDLTTVNQRIAAGDNVNQQMWDGWTALDSAAASPYKDATNILNALLAAGANPNLTTSDGLTPLMVAAMNSTIKFAVPFNMPADRVNALLKTGVNINARDSQGRTALMWAAMTAREGELQTDADPSVVQALLGAGADRTLKDNSGKTALDYATRESYSAIASALKNTTTVNGSVAGSVFQDFNGNGSRDSDDTELTGVIVYDDTNNNGSKDTGEANIKVDNAGNYIFNLSSGVLHHIRVVVPGGYTQTSPAGAYNITLSKGQVTGGHDFALKPGSSGTGSISGTVFNDVNSDGVKQANEQALSGFTVYNDANDNNTLDSGEAKTTSSSTGAYTFVNLSPGQYKIRVIPLSGWSQTWPKNNFGWTVPLAAGQGVTGDNFGLISTPGGGGGGGGGGGSTGSISGTVYNDANGNATRDSGENGIANITLYNDANNNNIKDSGELTATTDSSGSYNFTGLGAATYKIRQILQTGWSQTTPANSFGHTVTLASGQSVSGQDFGTEQGGNPPPPVGGSITGVVFNDADGDGVHDSNESGLSGITVYNDANNNSAMDSGEIKTTTDSSGTYSFTGLSSGAYKIREILQSGWIQTIPTKNYGHTINLATNQQLGGQDFGTKQGAVQTGGTISGTVFNDVNGNGTKDSGEVGVSGITIYNDANNNNAKDSGELTTTTDSNGAYSFTGLSSGAYKIRQILQTGWSQTTPANNFGHTINLATNQVLTGEDFGTEDSGSPGVPPPVTGASISGVVYNDMNANGVKDSTETGIGGRTVYVDLNNNLVMDSTEQRVTTDANGAYTVGGLSAGTYKVREILPSGWKQITPTKNYAQTVTVSTNQAVSGKDFGAWQSIAINGMVFNDANGNKTKDAGEGGLQGFRVYLDSNNDSAWQSTETSVLSDSGGNWSFQNLNPGTYNVRIVDLTGYKRTTQSTFVVALPPGGSTKLFGEQKIA